MPSSTRRPDSKTEKQLHQCQGKTPYDSHKEASNAMQSVHRSRKGPRLVALRDRKVKPNRLNVYQCSQCGKYHVGHAK